MVFWFLFPANITSNKRTILFSLVWSVSLVYMSVGYPSHDEKMHTLVWIEIPFSGLATNIAQGTEWPKTCIIEPHKFSLSHTICPYITHHLPKWRNISLIHKTSPHKQPTTSTTISWQSIIKYLPQRNSH